MYIYVLFYNLMVDSDNTQAFKAMRIVEIAICTPIERVNFAMPGIR